VVFQVPKAGSGHQAGEKAAISDQRWLLFGEKPDFPGDFQRPNLTMRDILGWKIFHRH
jgi:hypothetical protein